MKPERSVAIVGMYKGHMMQHADMRADEVWICATGWKVVNQYDVLYELHPWDSLTDEQRAHITTEVHPVELLRPDQAKTGRAFPGQQIMDELKTYYFTNSASWMLGHAIVQGFTKVGLYGVELGRWEDIGLQKGSMEYLIGLARGRGVEVCLPPGCSLCWTPYVYGYDQEKMYQTRERLKHRRAYYFQMLLAMLKNKGADPGVLAACAERYIANDDTLEKDYGWRFGEPDYDELGALRTFRLAERGVEVLDWIDAARREPPAAK